MGNRTSGGGRRGVRKTFVRLPGFLVTAQVCVPRAHAHALWLLPWVERLLLGQSFDEILSDPPWPRPVDALVVDQLVRTLLDLRWVVPDWTSPNLVVAPALARRFSERGRIGLAQELFDAEIISGEWWADGLGGTVLARQTALQFDWDFAREADIILEPATDRQALLDAADPDLTDLVLKLGGVDSVWGARDRVFLGTSLLARDRKDILFAMYSEQPRLLPDELRELEQYGFDITAYLADNGREAV